MRFDRTIRSRSARSRKTRAVATWSPSPTCPDASADGETVEEAIAEARDAFEAWTTAEREDAGTLPAPKTYSGQFVQRIPKTLHMRLARRAESEGVSLNHLAATLLAEGLAGR